MEYNFLIQMMSAPPGMLFGNREGTSGDVMVGVCLACSDHKMMELLIFGEVRKVVSRTAWISRGLTLAYLEI